MIEIRTIGAGGGSIARVEHGGLRVGPDSAGADPGPACYLRGGDQPTVTDANLALGLIDPAQFLGGGMTLGSDAARLAVDRISTALELSGQNAADGIVQVANAAMADAVRLSLFEKGANPSDFVLAAFGGAGGLHACAVAEALDIRQVLFPASASTLSARGILDSDIRHDLVEARLMIADHNALGVLSEMLSSLQASANDLLATDGIPVAARHVQIAADMRYRGQAWEITTPWVGAAADAESLQTLIDAFHHLHQSRYAHSAPDHAVEIVALRARAIGQFNNEDRSTNQPVDPIATVAGTDPDLGTTPSSVTRVARGSIGPDPIPGPLIVDEEYSSLWIRPGWSVSLKDAGDILATRDT